MKVCSHCSGKGECRCARCNYKAGKKAHGGFLAPGKIQSVTPVTCSECNGTGEVS